MSSFLWPFPFCLARSLFLSLCFSHPVIYFLFSRNYFSFRCLDFSYFIFFCKLVQAVYRKLLDIFCRHPAQWALIRSWITSTRETDPATSSIWRARRLFLSVITCDAVGCVTWKQSFCFYVINNWYSICVVQLQSVPHSLGPRIVQEIYVMVALISHKLKACQLIVVVSGDLSKEALGTT